MFRTFNFISSKQDWKRIHAIQCIFRDLQNITEWTVGLWVTNKIEKSTDFAAVKVDETTNTLEQVQLSIVFHYIHNGVPYG